MLAEVAPGWTRNRAFARYSLTGALAGAAGGRAAGGLAAGIAGRDTNAAFLRCAALGLTTGALPLFLSARAEPAEASRRVLGNLRPLAGLAGLFALDAFGGGMVANALIAYWLHVRFGAPTSVLGPLFAAIAVLQAGSYELAGRLADRFGLINTMVFTHLPSNLVLLLVPSARPCRSRCSCCSRDSPSPRWTYPRARPTWCRSSRRPIEPAPWRPPVPFAEWPRRSDRPSLTSPSRPLRRASVLHRRRRQGDL